MVMTEEDFMVADSRKEKSESEYVQESNSIDVFRRVRRSRWHQMLQLDVITLNQRSFHSTASKEPGQRFPPQDQHRCYRRVP